jgi:hypothetical protein
MVCLGYSTQLWCGWDEVHTYGVAGIQYTLMVYLGYSAHLWCVWDTVHTYGVAKVRGIHLLCGRDTRHIYVADGI